MKLLKQSNNCVCCAHVSVIKKNTSRRVFSCLNQECEIRTDILVWLTVAGERWVLPSMKVLWESEAHLKVRCCCLLTFILSEQETASLWQRLRWKQRKSDLLRWKTRTEQMSASMQVWIIGIHEFTSARSLSAGGFVHSSAVPECMSRRVGHCWGSSSWRVICIHLAYTWSEVEVAGLILAASESWKVCHAGEVEVWQKADESRWNVLR